MQPSQRGHSSGDGKTMKIYGGILQFFISPAYACTKPIQSVYRLGTGSFSARWGILIMTCLGLRPWR